MKEPVEITDELFAAICARIAQGETLMRICHEPGMPTPQGFGRAARMNDERAKMRQEAREAGIDAMAEKAVAIALEQPRMMQTETGTRVDPGDVADRKLKAEFLLKMIGKWDKPRYGDHMTLAGDPAAPLSGVSDDKLDEKIAALIQQATGAAP